MKTFRDNGLTIVLAIMFLSSVIGMVWAGYTAHSQELLEHGSPPLGLLAYMADLRP